MELVSVIGLHGSPVDVDTIESILAHATKKIVAIVDGAASKLELPIIKINGFYHNKPTSPCRNVALGLMMAVNHYPNFDWLCYNEYDTLFASDTFKLYLQKAEQMGAWMVGSNGTQIHGFAPNVPKVSLSFFEKLIIKDQFKNLFYALGCCMFFHRKFINKLLEINFFEKFLHCTNYTDFIPGYNGYDISEHLYPTMAYHFGGGMCSLSSWNGQKWDGNKIFPLRWKPELEATGDYQDASILHPIKDPDNYWRVYFREKGRGLRD